MGVDGLYQTGAGELCAYQVKYRSRRPALTWEELSTFMGLTDQVSQRVLFTNCEALPDLMRDRSGFIAIRGSDLDRLNSEDFAAMRQWLRGGQVVLPRKQPRPHQQEALVAIAGSFDEADRATVIMACGTGKSLVALWVEKHPRFHMHFTPTSSSWLNMVERFFRDITDQRIRRGVFTSAPDLEAAINEYIAVHNAKPKPFIWTAKASDILAKVTRARANLNKNTSI